MGNEDLNFWKIELILLLKDTRLLLQHLGKGFKTSQIDSRSLYNTPDRKHLIFKYKNTHKVNASSVFLQNTSWFSSLRSPALSTHKANVSANKGPDPSPASTSLLSKWRQEFKGKHRAPIRIVPNGNYGECHRSVHSYTFYMFISA